MKLVQFSKSLYSHFQVSGLHISCYLNFTLFLFVTVHLAKMYWQYGIASVHFMCTFLFPFLRSLKWIKMASRLLLKDLYWFASLRFCLSALPLVFCSSNRLCSLAAFVCFSVQFLFSDSIMCFTDIQRNTLATFHLSNSWISWGRASSWILTFWSNEGEGFSQLLLHLWGPLPREANCDRGTH